MSKENRLTIYKNNKKITPNHPDFNAYMYLSEDLPAGKYIFGIYNKKKEDGEAYQGGVIRQFEKKEAEPAQSFHEPKEPSNLNDDLDSEDVPF